MSIYYTKPTIPGSGTRARAATIEDLATSVDLGFDAVEADITSAGNFVGLWSSLTGPLAVPASVYHLNNYWMLLSDLADVTAKVPGTDVEWAKIWGSQPVVLPDWPVAITYDTGKIDTVIYSQLDERYRQTVTYTGSKVTSVAYDYSANAGATYLPLGTETLVYTGDDLTSTTWS